nr:MAG: RNA-dependent RNA polymerase [Chemarfal virus 11]
MLLPPTSSLTTAVRKWNVVHKLYCTTGGSPLVGFMRPSTRLLKLRTTHVVLQRSTSPRLMSINIVWLRDASVPATSTRLLRNAGSLLGCAVGAKPMRRQFAALP